MKKIKEFLVLVKFSLEEINISRFINFLEGMLVAQTVAVIVSLCHASFYGAAITGFCVAIVADICKEVVLYLPVGRDLSIIDFIINVFGAFIGSILMILFTL